MPTIMNRKWRQRLSLLVGLYLCVGADSMSYAASPDDFKTKEYNFSTGLSLINAADAYALGYTGKGIVLGVADQYVNVNHVEFSGKLKSGTVLPVLGTYDWAELNHGTHVGGIMAAAKNGQGMHGVAFDADLLSGEIEFTEDFFKSLRISYQAFQADKGIKSINNSWGSNIYYDVDKKEFAGQEFRELADILESAIRQDKVLIFAAGNSGHPTPAAEGMLPYLRPAMASSFISVVSVDPAGFNGDSKKAEINFVSIFSDQAKYAEETSIAAPGDGIWSAYAASNSSYIPMSGTSMAAPHVTAVAGLVQQAFPYMSGRQITDTLLSSANRNFTLPDYTVTMQDDYTGSKANLYYFGPKQAEATIRGDLAAYYTANKDRLRVWYGYQDADTFVADALKTGTIYGNVPREMIVGQGLLDAGTAVRGPGLFNARRMDKSNRDSQYGEKPQALYRINTQGYDSIWNNDIGETKAGLLNNSPDNPYADLKAIYNYYIESDEIIGKEKSVTFTQGQQYITEYNAKVAVNGLEDLPVGLIKSGLGTLTLSGNNTYTGSTIAAGGVLQINGSVAGDAWSVDSGTIAGIGTISSDLTNQSIVRPGSDNKPGTLSVSGELKSTGTIAVAATGAAAYSKLKVEKSATVGGTTFMAVPGSIYQVPVSAGDPTPYAEVIKVTQGTIAGTLSPDYSAFTGMLSAKGTISDDSKSLSLRLVRANNLGSMTGRQQQTYTLMDSMFTGQSGMYSLYSLDAAKAKQALIEIYGGAQLNQAAAVQSDTFIGTAVAARMDYVNSSTGQSMTFQPRGFAPGNFAALSIIPLEFDGKSSWWLKTIKNWGAIDAQQDLPGIDNRSYGLVVGQDRKVNDHWRLGYLVGYGQNRVTSSLAATDSHGYRMGVYGGYSKGAFDLHTYLDYGRQNNHAARYLPTLNRQANSNYDSKTLSFGLGARYNLHAKKDKLWQVSPYADLYITRYNQNGYKETGAGDTYDQIADNLANTYSTGEIGLEVARSIPKGRYAFHLGYKKVLSGSNPEMTVAYSIDPYKKSTVSGSEQDREYLVLGLTLQGQLAKNLTIDGQINQQLGAKSRNLTASVTLRKMW